MILLVVSVVFCVVSATVEDSPDLQLFRYNNELKILSSLLAKECPNYIQQKREMTDFQNLNLELEVSYLQHLKQQLVKCRRDKVASTTSRYTANERDSASFCRSYDGDSVFLMQVVSHNNPTGEKAPGVLCKTGGSPCSISLEICVSAIKSTNCEFYHHVTDVVSEKPKPGMSDDFGNLTTPVKINQGNRKWRGAHVHITIREKYPSNSLRVYHEVRKFSYDVIDVQGSPPRILTLPEKHVIDKTELVVMFTVPCPSSSPPTILPTTTTSSAVPAECLTATNLTKSWRLNHNGSDIKGGGPHSFDGYACDRYATGWFRFTGAAGTHMLDTCPKWKSCGTLYPHWTDETPPQTVGVTARITTYEVVGGNCKAGTWPIQVMRCSVSTDHDLIYRYYRGFYTTCYYAFCGMN